MGTKAPQAAGRIHTDFEKGFIMAEVMGYPDFKEYGSEAECKVCTPVCLSVCEKGFIMVEVLGYGDFKEYGSEAEFKVCTPVCLSVLSLSLCLCTEYTCTWTLERFYLGRGYGVPKLLRVWFFDRV